MTKIDQLIEAVYVLRDASYCSALAHAHNKGFAAGEERLTKPYTREISSVSAQKKAHAVVKEYADLKAERDRYKDALENIVIAYGMGWDMGGVIDVGRQALGEKTCKE